MRETGIFRKLKNVAGPVLKYFWLGVQNPSFRFVVVRVRDHSFFNTFSVSALVSVPLLCGRLGMVCEGEYELLEQIGRGSFGKVYRAQHDSGEVHAIKVQTTSHNRQDDLIFVLQATTIRVQQHTHRTSSEHFGVSYQIRAV